jgi:hypothetical protein
MKKINFITLFSAAALLLGGLLTTDLTGVPHGRLVLSVASVIIGHRKISFLFHWLFLI